MASPRSRVVLLFCHGSSFTKETWAPIIRRLQRAPLVQRVACEAVAFDWRFHGERFDHSDPGTLTFRDGAAQRSPRVEHAIRHWPAWAGGQLRQQIEQIRGHGDDDRRTRIVAVGHSMGATAQLQYEVQNPGTFDGFIGFEPVFESGLWATEQAEEGRDMLVSVALAREGAWNSWEDAERHVKASKAFRRWHPEAVDAYLESAFVRDGDVVKLATTPLQEAAGYCHEFVQLPAETLAKAHCPLFIEHAERTFFFDAAQARALAEQLKGKLMLGDVMPKTTHCMVLEDPDASTHRILNNLAMLPLFQGEQSRL